MLQRSFTVFYILVTNLLTSQTTYTWNGSASALWNVASNWTPNGVPASTDNVNIVSASNTCSLTANSSVNNFTLTSGTFNTGTYTLTINGNATFTNGIVNGSSGLLDCEGPTVVFGTTTTGPIINAAVIINALTVKLQRTTFNNKITITKLAAGTSTDSWRGGNTFNGTFILNNASADPTDDVGDIYLGANANDPTDVFNGRATFSVTGCARIRIPQNGSVVFNNVTSFYSNGYGTVHDRIQPARTGTAIATFNDSTYFYCNSATTDMQIAYDANTKAIFNGPVVATHYGPSAAAFMFGNDGTVLLNDNLTLNCLGTGAITITNGTGNAKLAAGKTITTGSLGFSSGRLDIENFTQLGNTPQTLTLTGTAALAIGASGKPCVFNADVNYAAPRISLLASTFNGNCVFTKTGASADDCGGNTFNNTIIINNSGSNEFRFSSVIAADVFTTPLDVNNTGSGSVRLSRTYATSYPQNITVSNTTGGGITFGSNGGSSTLANNKLITVGSGGYANGYLYLYRFYQASVTTQNINLAGANTVLRMGDPTTLTAGCSFPGDFTASAKGIELTGNTFGGISAFNQSGSTTTRAWGGNTFTGAHTINVSNAAGIQCSQTLAADTYSSTVDLNLSGSGSISMSRSFNTTYPENIKMTGTSTGGISFGFSGGSSTLMNGKTISIGPAGFSGNFLYLYKFYQIGNTSQSLTLTGSTAEIQIGSITTSTYGCSFDGNLNVTSPNFVVTSSTFNGNTSFIKNGGDDDDNLGNNTFNGTLSFTNSSPTTGIFVRMSNLFGPDTYNGTSAFSTSCTNGGFVLARTYDGYFNNDVTVNSTGGYIYFGAGGSLSGSATLAASKTITCGTYTSGLLSFRRFYQLSNTSQVITTTGTANIEFGGNTTNTNVFSNFEGALTATSANYIAITSSVFQRNAVFSAKYYLNFVNSTFNTLSGNTSLSRLGGTSNDDLGGGNTINGNFSFVNTGSGRFRSGVTAYGGDQISGNATIANSGAATISFAYNNATNTISGNLDLSNTSTGSIIYGEAATTNAMNLSGIINASSGNYTNGTINIRYLTQTSGTNSVTGSASAVSFILNNCTLNGPFTLSNSGTSTFTATTFNDNVTTTNSNTTTIRTCTLNAVNSFSSTSFVLGGTLAQGNTFNNGATLFTKTGTSNDDVNGGNTFNGQVSFITTNASGRWRLGVTSADDFNNDVSFNQQAAGILAPNYDAISTYAGNITVAAPTGSAITFGSGTGRALLDGSNSQTISKTSGNDPNFTRLTAGKSANSITLNTRINIVTDLTLTQGIINTTQSNILNMNNAATTTIGNATSYINGPMNYDMALSGTRTLNFPLGKASDWRPAVLDARHNNATSYTYNSEVFNADAHALGWAFPVTVNTASHVHWWDITRSNTSTGVVTPTLNLNGNQTITLYYGANDGVTDPTYLTILKNTYTAGTTWIDIGGTGATVTAGSVSSTSSPSAFNSFSRFTLGNKILGSNPLPIELLYFNATAVNNETVDLDWATATETNNSHFEIERSADGANFEYLATVKAYGNGNSVTKQTYQSFDKNPLRGVSYYRLKQVDKTGGKYEYSNPVMVDLKSTRIPVSVFPNPASGNVYVRTDESYLNASFKMMDATGHLVKTGHITDVLQTSINTSDLASGIYFLVLEKGTQTEQFKISIQN